MNCKRRPQIDPYLDGELSESAAAEMEAHLRGCAECAADALGRLRLKRSTQAAGRRFTAPAEFRRRLERSIGAAKPARFEWARPRSLAAAAAFALVLAAAILWFRGPQGDLASDELADLHVATLASAHPVDVDSSDRHTVKPWFQGKLPFSFDLPELEGSPFRLLGGRVAWFRQSPGAQLLYQIREHRISVFIFRERPEFRSLGPNRQAAFVNDTWTGNGLRYFILGDANRADIRELSDLLRRAARP